jgi:hypothetical protein
MNLFEVVQDFAQKMCLLNEADLEHPWKWLDYEEGVRFAFFRTYEDLRDLAADLYQERVRAGSPVTHAQHILAQHHAAYRDLQAVLLGINEDQAARVPVPGEWSVYTTLYHIVEAEWNFLATNRYALERCYANDARPANLPEETWEMLWNSDPLHDMKPDGSLAGLEAYYAILHLSVSETFSDVGETELKLPVAFWEDQLLPLRFRLHRFDSHLRQHTVQIEKTLAALDLLPTEAQRLLRLIYAALAEVEGSLIGVEQIGLAGCQAVAAQIGARTAEISALLAE